MALMAKLWQKNWTLNKELEAFETKDDLELDGELVPYDVYGSLAHAAMLRKIGILSAAEFRQARQGLLRALSLHAEGKFRLVAGDEDAHTKIENYLTKQYGAVGRKIHTGRSRNDQVLTALRLLTADKLLDIEAELAGLAAAFAGFAKKYEFMPMPGYTHMQRAMPSSVGMWAGSFSEALLDDVTTLQGISGLLDQSPLGSAAGYGVPLGLDREFTARLLGFSRVQSNSLYVQNSRGKFEALVLAGLVAVLSDINRFASDILLFSTKEFGLFAFRDEMYSGSSIMPQKKNLDVAELLRGKAKKAIGNYVAVASLPLDLISGYNRDLQDMKRPLMESLSVSLASIRMAELLVANLSPVKEKLLAANSPEIYAAHEAFRMAQKGTAFRDAYKAVGAAGPTASARDPEKELHLAKHSGATGNLGLARLMKNAERTLAGAKKRRAGLAGIFKKLKAIK